MTSATRDERISSDGAGLGTIARRVVPFIGMANAGCGFPVNRVAVWNTASSAPFSVANIKALSPEAKVTCVGRAGRGTVACGSKGLVLTLLSPVVALMAFRTASDDVITSELGAAPTTIPLVGATARRELVGAGRASSGQGVGRNRTLLSPETPLKPTS